MDDQTNNANNQSDVEEILDEQTSNQDQEEGDDKAAEYLAGWQRALADYKNLQEKSKFQSSLTTELTKAAIFADIMPIIDNFNIALTHVPEDKKTDDWVVGLFHVKQQLLDLCKQHSLELIAETDIEFDPNIHEAVAYQPSEKPPDTVINIVSAGARLGDRVVKPAKVIVASKLSN